MLERYGNETIKTLFLASARKCHHDQIIHARVKQTSAHVGFKTRSNFTENQLKHRLSTDYDVINILILSEKKKIIEGR